MAELETKVSIAIHPGKGIGWITLGASLHAILTRLKAQPQTYPALDLSYSASDPISQPIALTLPANGLRLRFDGPDQRLRLIEVLDFSKSVLTYKNIELVRKTKASNEGMVESQSSSQGPPFRHVYNRLFGPSYAGEYVPPERNRGSSSGTYVLSYPGISFSFPLQDKAWTPKSDFVSLLSSTAAGPSTSMALYQGFSWPEVRSTLFTATSSLPRSLALSSKNKEAVPDEIEEVRIFGAGRVELVRRTLPSLSLTLNETTPQDLVAELGPPDAIYRKSDSRIAIHAGRGDKEARQESRSPAMLPNAAESDHSSAQSYAEDSDEGVIGGGKSSGLDIECFYNYFHHGFDVLVTHPQTPSPPFPNSPTTTEAASAPSSSPHRLVITKLLLHANVPGSYPFNRHRRSRWTIHPTASTSTSNPSSTALTSEMLFPELSSRLKSIWSNSGIYASAAEESSMQRGMVLNRGWGEESPESSVELLGGFEVQDTTATAMMKGRGGMNEAQQQSGRAGQGSDHLNSNNTQNGLSNTELFGFPGLLFEVLKNDAVSCLTVY